MFHGKTRYKWWCSIVMLVITRGIQRVSFTQEWCPFSREHSHHPITIYNQRSSKPGIFWFPPKVSTKRRVWRGQGSSSTWLESSASPLCCLISSKYFFVDPIRQYLRLEDAEFPRRQVGEKSRWLLCNSTFLHDFMVVHPSSWDTKSLHYEQRDDGCFHVEPGWTGWTTKYLLEQQMLPTS